MPHYDTNTNSFMHNHNLNIASLNCRNLVKASTPEISSDFIRYLRSLHLDILCVQESHAVEAVQDQLNLQFQAHDTLWTQHCGIISFNPLIQLHSLDLDLDQRIIACKVVHANALFPPFTLLNVYAPAQYSPRVRFFRDLLTLPLFDIPSSTSRESLSSLSTLLDSDPSNLSPMLLMGDFNYHATSYLTDDSDDPELDTNNITSGAAIHRHFHRLINTHLFECTHSREEGPLLPTYRRRTGQSTIDYLYASNFLFQHLHSSEIMFLDSSWTDHALLRARFVFSSDRQGSGLWRANPNLSTNPYFIDQLFTALDDFFNTLEISASIDIAASIPPASPQDNWDALKTLVQEIVRRVSRDRSSALGRQCKRLQRKRNRICRQYTDPRIRAPLLSTIEKQIGILQREIASNLRLRAGKHWREQGETSAGYLKRTIATRAVKKAITSLINPVTNSLCTDPSSMQTAASSFYATLYSCDAVDSASIDSLCATIPDSDTIADADHDTLQQPFTIADLLTGTHRTKFQSSPGIDGLPYPILNIIFNHQKAAQLAVKVFNDALNLGIFPSSWLQTCICLLPKSGDLSNLKNWRPLSLICCDAKIFTRLLNQRLMPFMNKIICPQQSGFMPGRFIGDNGMILNNTRLIAAETSSDSIALLLDQEKAYDRIHPDYLRAVMQRFNLPTNIIHSLITLLFSTQIHININGHISTSSITQQRGIRQGDPISPLLFNIAFDPFLRSIQQDPQFTGFNLHTEAPPPTNQTTSDDISVPMQQLFPDNDGLAVSPDTPAPPDSPSSAPLAVKILAYADDTLVYLHDTQDFHRLQTAITMYMKASNALLNYHKTVATSLSGNPSATWQALLATYGINAWHDRTSATPLIYLGYPICSSITQRNVAFQKLYDSIRNAIALHSQRNISIRGRATILNSLIYSKLWHVLRLTTFTRAQLLSLRSLGTSFINFRIFPRLSFATLSLPRSAGGLGLLDPLSQQQALQWYWVCPLLLQYLVSPAFPKYTTPSLSVLTYTLSWCYYSTVFPHFFYYLLFPYARHRSWFPQSPSRRHSYLNPITNLQSCLSLFQITERHNLYVDAVTCYSLPLYDILLHSPPTTNTLYSSSFIPPNLLLDGSNVAKKLLVSDIFRLDADHQVLRVRSSFQFASHPIVSQRVADFINSRQLIFQPFFAQQCFIAPRPALDPHQPPSLRAFCRSIFVPPSSSPSRSRLPLNSIRFFKKLRKNLPSSSSSLSPLQPPQWRSFWTLAIPLAARTVWYRAIYEKIPTRALLHLRIPDNHPSHRCIICPASPTEDITHALFSCPPKLLVWRYMYHTYLSASPSISDVNLIHFLQQTLLCSSPLLDRDPSLSFNELSIPQLFATTLLTIWQAHWRWIFDRTPFIADTVQLRLARSLARLDAELNLDS
ncbi:uncharacterized protein ATC70_010478 [Mucor velutinosus]|uniref:Reverse transcriptase domain-containing protein n=1 Tax=Mucor velutinosus TaxID=708070 RepID=A0AAN7I001_9FUNG|nr:hypothetical protein ATC70_010478 [Mucor velutinosus]